MVALLTELIPVAFGIGEEARIDWRPAYAALRFALLPVLSLALSLYVAVGVLRRASREECMSAVVALVIPVGYLVLLWFYPSPFFVRL